MIVPDGLTWWNRVPGGAAWLERLPRLVAECAGAWELTVEPPFAPATVSWVAPVRRRDGTPAVLKVSFPDAESEHEGAALAWWDGSGAARLLAEDRARRALLIERCDPGTPLWALPDDEAATRAAAGVLRALWRPAHDGLPFRRLADEGERWARELPEDWARHGRPFGRALLDEAVALSRELAASQDDAVVCHQDLHGGNVLRHGDGWRAIDPKPLAGERAFDVASLVRDRRPAAARTMRARLDVLAEELGIDRERARGWAIVHALAWSFDEDHLHADLVRCAELLSGRAEGA
jgi:streptomycin 6-kinase